jgi:hypothetical protein
MSGIELIKRIYFTGQVFVAEDECKRKHRK